MASYIVTGGHNRVTVVKTVGTDELLQLETEKLEQTKKDKTDLQWVVLPVEEAREYIGEVRDDPEAHRIRNGKVERRPSAWVDFANASPVVGDSVAVSVEFSDEPNPSARIKIVRYTGEGKIVDEFDSPVPVELEKAEELHVQPVSAPHVCLYRTLVVK